MPAPQLRIVPAHQPEIDQAISDFIAAKSSRAPKTVKGYAEVLHLFRRHVGSFEWPVTPEAVDSFLADCKRRDLKVSTIDSYYGILKLWLGWLYKRGRIAANPIHLAEKPPHPKTLPRAPRIKDLQLFFDHLRRQAAGGKGHWLDVRALAFWTLTLDTGLRIGEVCALKVDDIRIGKGQRTAYIRGGKTNQDRTVFFSKRPAKELKRWLKVRKRLPCPAEVDDLFVCYVRGKWGGLTSWGARQALTRRCQEWGLPHLRPHDFRHAYAIYAIWKNAPLTDVQKQLGHEHLATTERYTQANDMGRRKRHKKHSPVEKTIKK